MSGAGQDSGQAGVAGTGQPLKRTHQVTVLGQQYSLRTEATPEQVQEVVDFIHRSLAEVSGRQKAVDTLDVAVLTLLNVAGSYLHLKQSAAVGERRLDVLLEKLDRFIPDGGEASR
ncbi:cell division protein ZapA [Geoalkalibacter ferrihydriticus]|uniref:Cell division protein ZapA n=1 Tax=Geoalkalibacter ferrihydriticus TaxID=392333 RepID=A0A1G9JHW3_9BACT|nr:cell division protein ZapA [Geoalkalibacter ferrihydriticus]SDL37177.1 cell division protein ZapA [Geoalkalibacter ferrihydriticus]